MNLGPTWALFWAFGVLFWGQIFAQDEEIVSFGRPPDSEDQFFAPRVTATCRAGIMTVKGSIPYKNIINFAKQY